MRKNGIKWKISELCWAHSKCSIVLLSLLLWLISMQYVQKHLTYYLAHDRSSINNNSWPVLSSLGVFLFLVKHEKSSRFSQLILCINLQRIFPHHLLSRKMAGALLTSLNKLHTDPPMLGKADVPNGVHLWASIILMKLRLYTSHHFSSGSITVNKTNKHPICIELTF